MQVQLNRRVPVAPGITLATDVYLPSGPGSFPVVVTRTPYRRTAEAATAREFVDRGFGFVAQECRGKYDSDGEFVPFIDEAHDGHVTIDWVANQKWCNGRIGLWGRSYPGMVQIPAAARGHEALRCIAPSIGASSLFTDWIRYDGCYALANTIRWTLTNASCRTQPATQHFTWQELYELQDIDLLTRKAGMDPHILREWIEHDRFDEYWSARNHEQLQPSVRVPSLNIGGLFDHMSRGQIETYGQLRSHGHAHRLMLGPWGHKTLGQRAYGEWDFGPAAAASPLSQELAFFEYHLKDMGSADNEKSPVNVFVMGPNRWYPFADWPPPEVKTLDWHLTSGGGANTFFGDGLLCEDSPASDRNDRYSYDPENPVPTVGGPIYWGLENPGPVSQSPLAERRDVLCYRSPELTHDVSVIGEPTLRVTVSSSTQDTDLVAKLCVQHSDHDSVFCLTLGSARLRYRHGYADPQPLRPGVPTEVDVRLNPTAFVFPRGSRIVLLLTSSDFPRINAHPNTMEAPLMSGKPRPARIEVHHGATARARLSLPTVSRALLH